MAASDDEKSHRNPDKPIAEEDELYHISQVTVESDVSVRDDGRVFDFVWDAADMKIARTTRYLERCWDKRICDDKDPISIE